MGNTWKLLGNLLFKIYVRTITTLVLKNAKWSKVLKSHFQEGCKYIVRVCRRWSCLRVSAHSPGLLWFWAHGEAELAGRNIKQWLCTSCMRSREGDMVYPSVLWSRWPASSPTSWSVHYLKGAVPTEHQLVHTWAGGGQKFHIQFQALPDS